MRDNAGASSSDLSALTALLPPPSYQTPLLTLVWFKSEQHPQDARQVVNRMLRHTYGPYSPNAVFGGDVNLAWGLLVPDLFAPCTCWSVYQGERELCLFEGELYEDLPQTKLQPGENPELAHYIVAQMRERPTQRVANLNGLYSGIYIDRQRACAYLFSDLTGTRPVFWLSNSQQFVVTGNLWAFRGCEGFERRWDTMALTQMLTIGFPLAGRTWLADIHHLQRGRQVRSFADGRTEVHMLQKPVPRQSWSPRQSVRGLRGTLDETVERIYRRVSHPVGLGLSGGLDSRTLLASLYTQGLPHENFTFCVEPQEADHRIAQAAAKLLGEPHRTIILDRAAADVLYRETVLLNEGESFGFGLQQFAASASRHVTGLMIGYESSRVDPPGAFNPWTLKSTDRLAACMLQGYMTLLTVDQISRLLAPPYRASWQDVLDEWFDSFAQIEQQSVIDVCLDHMMDYSHQRRIRPRIDSLRWFTLPIYPYLDERLYTVYRSLPLPLLRGDRIYLDLLRNYKTGLENFPSAARSWTGLPIRKEYGYRHVIHYGRFIQQKLALPMQRQWQALKNAWRLEQNTSDLHRIAERFQLASCQVFRWPTVQYLIEQTGRGEVDYRASVNRLINVAIVDDFLFGPRSSIERPLRGLERPNNPNKVSPTPSPTGAVGIR